MGAKSPFRSCIIPPRIALCIALLLLTLVGSLAVHPAQAASARQTSIVDVQVSHDRFLAHSEPSLAENPHNRLNLIAGSKMFTDPAHYRFKIGTYYTTDGGRTWHDSGLLPGFQPYTLTSDISIAFSSSGVAYAVVLAEHGKTSGVFVSRSTNGGKTFSQPATVFLDTSGSTFSDKPWITVDRSGTVTDGTVYVAWNLDGNRYREVDAGAPHRRLKQQAAPAPPTGLVVSHSTDGGRTFSAPVVVNPFNNQEFPLGAIPQVAPNGTVSVAYAGISNNTGLVNQLDMVQSTDGGITFSAPRAIIPKVVGLPNHLPSSNFRNLSLPSFAVSRHDGSMVVVWADERYGDADILASTSMDGGLTWSAPVRVNHDRVGDGKDQFQPVVAVAPDGIYTCAWFDRRYDPKNHFIDEEIAQSTNDGLRFGRNIRVTKQSWNPTVDAPRPEGKASNTFIGDYQALAVDNHTVHPLWNDTQNQVSQQIETAVLSEQVFMRH